MRYLYFCKNIVAKLYFFGAPHSHIASSNLNWFKLFFLQKYFRFGLFRINLLWFHHHFEFVITIFRVEVFGYSASNLEMWSIICYTCLLLLIIPTNLCKILFFDSHFSDFTQFLLFYSRMTITVYPYIDLICCRKGPILSLFMIPETWNMY